MLLYKLVNTNKKAIITTAFLKYINKREKVEKVDGEKDIYSRNIISGRHTGQEVNKNNCIEIDDRLYSKRGYCISNVTKELINKILKRRSTFTRFDFTEFKVLYCPKCKGYHLMDSVCEENGKIVIYPDYSNEAKRYICVNCGSEFDNDNKGLLFYNSYRTYNKYNRIYIYLEPSRAGNMLLKIIIYKDLYNRKNCQIKVEDEALTRIYLDLDSHNYTYKSCLTSDKVDDTSGYTNITQSNLTYDLELLDIEIPQKCFETVAKAVSDYYIFKYHSKDIKEAYILEQAEKYTLRSLLKLVDYPYLSTPNYVKLKELEYYRDTLGKSIKENFASAAYKKVKRDRFINLPELTNALELPLANFKFKSAVAATILSPTYSKDLIRKVESSIYAIDYTFQQEELVNHDSILIRLYYTYLSRCAGLKYNKIQNSHINFLCTCRDKTTYRDISTMLLSVYRYYKENQIQGYENLPPTIKDLLLPEHVDSLRIFLKQFMKTSSVSEFHAKVLAEACKVSVLERDITYSTKFIEHTNKENTYLDEFTGDEYQIIPASNTLDLRACTEDMFICVVTYWESVLKGETNIFFLVNTSYKPGSGKYFEGCIEINNDYKIQQIKGRKNRSINPLLKDFVSDWADKNELKINTSDLNMKDYLDHVEGKNPYTNYIMQQLIHRN